MTDDDTIFHKIIRKEIPAKMVYEDEQVVAFRDVNPIAPTHVLIVPKKSIKGVAQVSSVDESLLGHMIVVAAQIAREEEIEADGYRLVFNCGEQGGQTVFQLHLHLVGGRQFSWPPG